MSAKWEKQGTNDGTLTFEIDLNTIQKGMDQAFTKVKKNINVPGFRKGHVSRQVFNRMFGEGALYEDALNLVLPDAYDAAVKEAAISPVDQPKFNVEKMDADEPWVISAKVTVKPEVTLGDYKGLTVPKQDREVTDKDLDDKLHSLQEEQAELVLKEDGAIEKGDTAIIDYEGSIDGKPFDGGKADNYSLEIGSGSFIPGFEDQLVGHKSGDNVDVKVTFPEDYQAKDLAGKEAIFKVTIHEIKEKQLPDLDDEFAKDVDEDVDTLDELKAKLRDQLKQDKDQKADDAIQESAVNQAVANATIADLPEVMIDSEVHNQMDQYLGNLQRQGINPQMYYQLTGTSEADLHKQFEADAGQRVKTDLVLEAVVKAEDINPSEDDVNNEIKSLAAEYGMKEADVRNALTPDMLKHDIGIKKAIDLIVSSAKEE
ncbi:trigger factor [Schleiferilactobacillus harbinensis]|jgi:trigger factor|uniref:Trigger factor n=2 Tax=Schleiferilactobacillus harbinensis TaxID=304207 RepID=A0A510TXP3_9LACO|nr:trigger factor [Schleiferilactobacillus harbinensis]HAY52439.1 trigger factor [Lactobacillus sp.]KRM28433.1 trigger factor [Schleiferilactobacillus harbinensis DSM 16991]MBO3090338.1 trigger factor [Schleiferilactobacillus harbinensis]MCI1687339.1 trigger factor [Schleiferilactobacillus harbinensis]MCI1782718.1 trigger factor [Schleiferilactobacillus harbinensis]